MKEAIGGVSLFQIVIVFLLLFTGVMCLTINHSKAFGVKDEIINILENDIVASNISSSTYEIDEETTLPKILDYLNESGHRITGECPGSDWIGYTRDGGNSQNEASFCIRAVKVHDVYHDDLIEKCKNNKCYTTSGDFPSMVYYDVVLFYQLDIPVIKSFTNFELYGSTKVLFG